MIAKKYYHLGRASGQSKTAGAAGLHKTLKSIILGSGAFAGAGATGYVGYGMGKKKGTIDTAKLMGSAFREANMRENAAIVSGFRRQNRIENAAIAKSYYIQGLKRGAGMRKKATIEDIKKQAFQDELNLICVSVQNGEFEDLQEKTANILNIAKSVLKPLVGYAKSVRAVARGGGRSYSANLKAGGTQGQALGAFGRGVAETYKRSPVIRKGITGAGLTVGGGLGGAALFGGGGSGTTNNYYR